MKKNYMMRLAAVLLVLVLLSTCVISGTFAKYVTTGNASDTAQVAKWGVKITAEAWADDNLEENLSTAEDHIVVSASSDLLAPGTGINFASINITGTPEVAVKVTYAATLTLEGWTVDSSDYMPVAFKVNGVEYKAATMEALKTAVEQAIASYSKEYAAGTDLSTKTADELTVSCYWAFTGDDVKDTALGNAAAEGNPAKIKLDITCTVTQID